MGEQARQLYAEAIDAYVELDAAKAAAIDDMDSYLDGLQKQFVQAIFESHAAGRIDLQVAVQLAVVARFYERIGDHAVNIGERVRYIVTGWQPEHMRRSRYRSAVDAADEVADRRSTGDADGDRAAALLRVGRDRASRQPVVSLGGSCRAERDRAGGVDDVRRAPSADRAARLAGARLAADRRRARRSRRRASSFRNRRRSTSSGTRTPMCWSRRPSRCTCAARSRGRSGARRSSCSGRRDDGGPHARHPDRRRRPRCLATIEDITERARLDAVRTDFVANISHELKTPVGALAVLAEAMVDERRSGGRRAA